MCLCDQNAAIIEVLVNLYWFCTVISRSTCFVRFRVTIPTVGVPTEHSRAIGPAYIRCVSKNCSFLFLSELHQISTNFNKAW